MQKFESSRRIKSIVGALLLLACRDLIGASAKAAMHSPEIPVAVFNGTTSYATISPWKATGKFGVFAQFSGAVPTNVDAYLLVDEQGRYISVRGGLAKARFSTNCVSASLVETPAHGYCAIFIEAGKLTAFDGTSMTESMDTNIITSCRYSVIGKRGEDYSPMGLRSLVLYDYRTPTNNRCYIAQEEGTLKDVVYQGESAITHCISAGLFDRMIFTPRNASPVTTLPQWEQQYTNAGYVAHHPCWVSAPTRATDYGESFAWVGSYWLETYLVLYNTTTNPVYLDRAVTLIDYMFANTDRARFDRGEITCSNTNGILDAYLEAPKPLRYESDGGAPKQGEPGEGWRRVTGKGKGWELIVLTDGVTTSGIAKYSHYVLSRPALSNYHAGARAYLEHCAKIVRAHDTTWSATKNTNFASYYYLNQSSSNWGDRGKWSGPVAYNHAIAAVTTMAICNTWIGKDPDFSEKINGTLAFWRKYTWKQPGGGLAWWYSWYANPRSAKSQDVGHACNIEIPDLYWLSRLGYPVSGEDFKDMVQGLFNHAEFEGAGMLSYRIDGSYKYPGDQVAPPANTLSVAQNMWPIAIFEPSLSDLARRAARVGFGSKSTLGWWGDFAVPAFDMAAKAGCLDIAAP